MRRNRLTDGSKERSSYINRGLSVYIYVAHNADEQSADFSECEEYFALRANIAIIKYRDKRLQLLES